MRVWFAFLAVFPVSGTTAATQGFGSGLDPVGVEIDANGVLRKISTDPDPQLGELWKRKIKDGELGYVSLPRILAEARKCVEKNQPIPDSLRYLGGLVKIQYLFVYPEEGDLVLAGRAEPFEAKRRYRPIGQKTGRPVLHLDDLVTALRACAGGIPPRIGVDIKITKEIARRVDDKWKEIAPKIREMGGQAAADALSEAGGVQPVEFYGIDPNTRFGFVCVEADYQLKQLGLNLRESPVKGVRSYFSMLTKPEMNHRFSLESHYDAIVASPDRNAFELRGPSLKVNGGILHIYGSEAGDPSFSAKKFISLCNDHFDELSRHLLSWADLANLGDLCLVAALVAKEKLAEKAKWDLSWVMDPKGYPVASIRSPTGARTLCNHKTTGGMLLVTSGGVGLFPAAWIEKISEDKEGKLIARARRPSGEIETPAAK